MKIKVLSYPLDMEFSTRVVLPKFVYACPVRTKLIRNRLKKLKKYSCHTAEDFIVEQIEKTPEGEIWHLGS